MQTVNAICGAVADACFGALAPLGPAWALLVISAVTGVLLLYVYRYASNQAGIRRVRADITANLLAIKLYKDEMRVMFRSQRRLMGATLRLLGYQVKPLAVMIVPMVLALVQMAMWYQFRPFEPGEPILVKVIFRETPADEAKLEGFSLGLPEGLSAETPPLRIRPNRDFGPTTVRAEYAQRLSGRATGEHGVKLGSGTAKVAVSVGTGFSRVRPAAGGSFWERLLYPGGPALEPDSGIESVRVAYPVRTVRVPVLSWLMGWIGADHWLVHYFVLATIVALLVKPVVGVHL